MISSVLVLVGYLLALVLAAVWVKRAVGRPGWRSAGPGTLAVQEAVSIGPGRQLLLVAHGRRRFLLASHPGGVTLVEAWTEEGEAAEPETFPELLAQTREEIPDLAGVAQRLRSLSAWARNGGAGGLYRG